MTVYTPDTAPAVKAVYVDGKQVSRAFYVDDRRGIVDYYPAPLKVHRHGKRAISRRLRGRVTVELRDA